MITTQGKSVIFRYLAGNLPRIADSIAIGIGSSAESADSAVLDFEADRVSVSLVSADIVNDKIIFKGTIPQEYVGTIYEVGLWFGNPPQTAGSSSVIVNFDSATEDWSTPTWNTTLARIGTDALQLAGGSSSTLIDVALDLSVFSDSDFMSMAYNADVSINNVALRFSTDDTNYYEYSFSAATGYEVKSMGKAAFVATGSPDWSDITSITVSATGTGNVVFDGIRAEDADTLSTDYALVARSVLGTPKVKTSDTEMDIEYALEITI